LLPGEYYLTMAARRFTFFHKLWLLLWKNVKLKLRSPVRRSYLLASLYVLSIPSFIQLTAVELVWPLFLFVVLLILRRIYGPIPQPDSKRLSNITQIMLLV